MRFLLRLLGTRLPKTEGELPAPLHSEVTIRRDRHGIVYVEAQNDDDAFFGLGFAEAQDRAFQLELFVRAARGTLAEVVGAEMLDADRLARRLGFRRNAQAQLEVQTPAVRAQLEAFIRGANFALRQGPRTHEAALLGAPPFVLEPADSLAVVQFISFALCSNWDAELARLRILLADGPEALFALEAADPSLIAGERGSRLERDARLLQAAEKLAADADRLLGAAPAGGASNNWVLAPSRTTTGRPLLACDPHLSPMLPAYWYLAHVRTPDWAVSGACFPCQPIASFGHNEKVAWGFTAGHHDNTDLFVERLSDDGTRALREGGWEACEVRDEVIRVRGRADVHERVVVTPRGPVVSPCLPAGAPVLSMRATWMAARPIASFQIFRAQTVAEARELFRVYPADSENRLFADVHGTIAWQLVGDAPARRGGHGLVPMPAWHADTGWEREPLPFDSLPGITNPPEGFLATANQPPRSTTQTFLGADWLDGGRYARIVELLAAREKWDLEATMRMQLDRTTVYWRALRETVLAAMRGSPAREAVGLLEDWDGVVGPDSAAAAVFEPLVRGADGAGLPRQGSEGLGGRARGRHQRAAAARDDGAAALGAAGAAGPLEARRVVRRRLGRRGALQPRGRGEAARGGRRPRRPAMGVGQGQAAGAHAPGGLQARPARPVQPGPHRLRRRRQHPPAGLGAVRRAAREPHRHPEPADGARRGELGGGPLDPRGRPVGQPALAALRGHGPALGAG
ncbi:MAG: penicillin acylase family protein [Myxococcales bacterium]